MSEIEKMFPDFTFKYITLFVFGYISQNTVITPVVSPVADPRPRVINIRKNRTENNCGTTSNLARAEG